MELVRSGWSHKAKWGQLRSPCPGGDHQQNPLFRLFVPLSSMDFKLDKCSYALIYFFTLCVLPWVPSVSRTHTHAHGLELAGLSLLLADNLTLALQIIILVHCTCVLMIYCVNIYHAIPLVCIFYLSSGWGGWSAGTWWLYRFVYCDKMVHHA